MCRFQKEISSKIREKKALESPPDSSSALESPPDGSAALESPAEASEGQTSRPSPSCDGTPGVIHKLKRTPDGKMREGSLKEEKQDNHGGESVGTAC